MLIVLKATDIKEDLTNFMQEEVEVEFQFNMVSRFIIVGSFILMVFREVIEALNLI
jgi:hypothetical protein